MAWLPKRGIVSIVFDDGYEKVFQNALPILNRHKIPGVFALPLDGTKLEQSQHRYNKVPQNVRKWSHWLDIAQQGHEISSHTETHPNLTKVPDDQLKTELIKSKEALGAKTLIYPGGAHDDRVVEEAKKHYIGARTVLRGYEEIKPQNPHRLKTFNFSRNNFKVWKANLFVLWAYLTNKWMIETYHMVDEDDKEMVHTVKTPELARHIAFISKLPIEVKTLTEVLDA